jgi:hypothetical protein
MAMWSMSVILWHCIPRKGMVRRRESSVRAWRNNACVHHTATTAREGIACIVDDNIHLTQHCRRLVKALSAYRLRLFQLGFRNLCPGCLRAVHARDRWMERITFLSSPLSSLKSLSPFPVVSWSWRWTIMNNLLSSRIASTTTVASETCRLKRTRGDFSLFTVDDHIYLRRSSIPAADKTQSYIYIICTQSAENEYIDRAHMPTVLQVLDSELKPRHHQPANGIHGQPRRNANAANSRTGRLCRGLRGPKPLFFEAAMVGSMIMETNDVVQATNY